MQQGYASGIEGCWDDCFAQITPWGFDLAAHIPGVEARLFDDEGHGTLRENHIGEVHTWLADRLAGEPAT
jgi:hypothetical protein